jgi:hypothetical protein
VQVKLFVYSNSKLAVMPRVKWLWPAPPMTKRQDECGAAHLLLPSPTALRASDPRSQTSSLSQPSRVDSTMFYMLRWCKGHTPSHLPLYRTLETSSSAPSHVSPLISVILHATQSPAQIYASCFHSLCHHIHGAAEEPVGAQPCLRAYQLV